MKAVILFLLLHLFISKTNSKELEILETEKKFHEFMIKYDKHYDTEEEYKKRLDIFKNHLDLVSLSQTNGNSRRTINRFSDLTSEEFLGYYTGFNPSGIEDITTVDSSSVTNDKLPENFSWVDKGGVTPVKFQMDCGSCYAFTACGHLESLWKIKYNEELDCSEQNIVDCESDSGCSGGNAAATTLWIKKRKGVKTESEYPYVGTNNTCKDDKKNYIFKNIKNTYMLSTKDEEVMKQYLYSKGPLMVAINATDELQDYSGGYIYLANNCEVKSLDDLNHAVLLVGYGVENGIKYWTVKNSWDDDWGEKGYFRIIRGVGACGINSYVTYSELNGGFISYSFKLFAFIAVLFSLLL